MRKEQLISLKIILTLIFSFHFFSCKNEKINENTQFSYYDNANNLVFKKTVNFEEFDSIYYFYKNESIFKKGKQNKNGEKIGKWMLYDQTSRLREIREYFCIKGKSEINRNWYLDKNEDTIAYNKENNVYNQKEFISDTLGHRNTSYDKFTFLTKDTISISDYYFGYAYCGSPLLREYDSKIKVIVDNTYTLNKDFSNIELVKLDTFQHAKIDTIHNADFGDYDLNKVAAFSGKFKTTGKKTIRGLMIEYTNDFITKDSVKAYAESRTYFEKEIFVKNPNNN